MFNARNIGRNTFSSLKIRNFRLYFIGQAISLTGTWMQTVGLAWLVLKMTGSGTTLGLVTAMQYLPILIFGPWGGVFADRFPKRKVLFFTQTASGLLALILAILVASNTLTLWMVYILALGLGLINALDNPVRQTFVMEMVGKEELANAVTLNSTEINLTRATGPAIGGIIISVAGLSACFFINAISYIAVLIVLLMMDKKQLHITPSIGDTKGKLIEGLKYAAANPVLRNTLLMMLIIGTLTYEFTISLPIVADNIFHAGANGFATLTAALGLGSVAGGLLTAGRKKTAPHDLIIAAALFGLAVILASLSGSFMIMIILMVLVGIFSVNFNILGNVMLQLKSEPQMRGRVMSLWSVAFLGTTPIGGPVIGWIGENIGARESLAVGGYAAVLAAVLGLLLLRKDRMATIRKNAISESIEAVAEKNTRPL
jgi:MFS family permease